MPHLDHVALWAVDLDSARDFYSHWFDGHANGLYENPRTGLRTHILHFAETPEDERGTRLEIMTRPDLAEGREAAGLGWAVGQLPRLRGRRGLHLPDPVGRWSAALGLSVIASWVLYLAYILLVARLATSYSSNWLISYGGWLAAQFMALVAVVILVKLVGRIWLVRGHHRRGRHAGGRWLTAPSALVLLCALTGAVVLLVALAYWGLFPMLL